MRYVRLRGLLEEGQSPNLQIFRDLTGYSFVADGRDLVIPEDDRQLREGPPPLFRTEPIPLSLSGGNNAEIADIYIERYVSQELEHVPPFRGNIQWAKDLGLVGQIEAVRHRLFFANTPTELKRALVETVIPFMHNEMDAKTVFPLAVDAKFQQALISLHRVNVGIAKVGKEKILKCLSEGNNFMALVSDTVLGYPNALLMFAPFAVTMPIGKVFSSLHFMCDGMWQLPYLYSQGLFELLLSPNNPIPIEEANNLHIAKLNTSGCRQYYIECIAGVNRLMQAVNDPLRFVLREDELDSVQAIKVQASINMMFFDIVAANFTNNKNAKVRHALAFLDKLANLIVAVQKVDEKKFKAPETTAFIGLLEPRFGAALSSLLKDHLTPAHDLLGTSMAKAVSSLYGSLEMDSALLRSIRNTQHGPHLKCGQFETIFFSDYNIPYELVYLPIFIMWGLMLDYDTFFSLTPFGSRWNET